MNEAFENEVELQIMAAVQGESDCNIRQAIMCRIDEITSNQVEPQTYAFQGACWTDEARCEIANRIKTILNTHYTTELGY